MIYKLRHFSKIFYVACSKWRFLAPFRIVVNENQSGILGLFQACEHTLQNGVQSKQYISHQSKY